MKVLIGCDVDPVLPEPLERVPAGDPWRTLDPIEELLAAEGPALPPITWLIRADASVRFATGSFASGYEARPALWRGLRARGHELGWHMHAMSPDARGRFRFDPSPPWLEEAHAALAAHFPVRATRTGWDWASDGLLARLDALGVAVDFSALPGNLVWVRVGGEEVRVDWLGCPEVPYHPRRHGHKRARGGVPLALLEVPIAQFRHGPGGALARWAWRLAHGVATPRGLWKTTRLLTQPWPALPPARGPVWALFFHPEDLTPGGLAHARRNLALLRSARPEFVTASALVGCEINN